VPGWNVRRRSDGDGGEPGPLTQSRRRSAYWGAHRWLTRRENTISGPERQARAPASGPVVPRAGGVRRSGPGPAVPGRARSTAGLPDPGHGRPVPRRHGTSGL